MTHDQEEALSMADHVGVMRAGHLLAARPAAEVYSNPVTNFVAEFVGSVSRLQGEVVSLGSVDVMGSRLAIPGSAGGELPAGTPVDVLVRPESIRNPPRPTVRRWWRAPPSWGPWSG